MITKKDIVEILWFESTQENSGSLDKVLHEQDFELVADEVMSKIETLPKKLSNQAYKKARELSYEDFAKWWNSIS